MRTFDYTRIPQELLTGKAADLIAVLHEDKGHLSALEQSRPGELEMLRHEAAIANTDASARVEGICVEPERVRELLTAESPEPRNADEREIVGYARALERVHVHADELELESGTVVRLFEELYQFEQFDRRSRYRRKDYVYAEVDGHMQAVPVSPITAFETPLVFGGACDGLALAFEQGSASPALLAAIFTVDFLCIRPFDRGNGRLARLFADLMLTKGGFTICHYTGVDKLIEQTATQYYDSLNGCVMGWDRNKNTYAPFASYWLDVLHRAHLQLFEQLEADGALSKSDRIERFVLNADGPVTKRQILLANPDISVSMVENVLGKLVREAKVQKIGAGRSTAYERL